MIRQMTESDFDVVCSWLAQRGVPESVSTILPKDNGYIVNDACACFVYTASNAPVCFVEWVISDPTLGAKESVKHLKELAVHIEEMAEDLLGNGIQTIMILSNAKLCKLFKRFSVGCRGETSLIFGG